MIVTATEPGTRAIQLYDSAVASYFLQTFGRNQRRIVCECERSNEPSMVQVLHLVNGDTVNKKLAASTGRVSQWLAAKTPDDTLIDDAYLAALSRRPTDDERTRLRAVLAETPEAERRAAMEDLLFPTVHTSGGGVVASPNESARTPPSRGRSPSWEWISYEASSTISPRS